MEETMSARSGIPKAFVQEIISKFNGTGDYVTNIHGSATNKTTHFDMVQNFPFISVTPGPESREAMPSMTTMAELTLYFRVLVNNPNDAQGELESIISDLETLIDASNYIEYERLTPSGIQTRRTISADITNITTDEGLLDPYAMGEIVVLIKYERTRKI